MSAQPQTPQLGWVLITFVAVVAVLHFGEGVLMPLALALLLTFLLAPLVSWLQRLGCNRAVAVTLTTVIAFALVGSLLYVVIHQFLGLVDDLPAYRDNLLEKVRALRGTQTVGLERGVEMVKDLSEELQKTSPGSASAPNIAKVQVVEPPPNSVQMLRGFFGPLMAPTATSAIVVVFVIFMLMQREDLRDRLVHLLGPREMHKTVQALDEAAGRVSRFLLMQTLINGIQGALVALGLYLIGVPDAMLWGSLTIVLRFIPYLGPMLAAIGPIALSIAFFDNWTYPLMTIALIVTLEVLSNNLLEPWLYSSSVGVSSLALIVATVFWTWLWGAAGLFLAIPLTVCLAVMGKYIPQLGFLSVLLSDRPVLEPAERLYQRLLANDPEEAEDLIDEARETARLLDVCDSMFLPVLRFVEQDHDRGAIDDAKRHAVVDQVRLLVEDLRLQPDPPSGETATAAPPAADIVQFTVFCLPAADRADEVAAELCAALLESAGMRARAVSTGVLKAEMLDHVDEAQPSAICISATPPAAVIHARYLCKRLRGRFADVPIVVGLWDAQGDMRRATDRLTSAGASTVVTSARSCMEELGRLHQLQIQGVKVTAEAPLAQAG